MKKTLLSLALALCAGAFTASAATASGAPIADICGTYNLVTFTGQENFFFFAGDDE